MAKKQEPVDFEQSLAELERLVEQMEQGEQPLEQALRQFEQGVELARGCHAALAAAEQRVELLLQQHDGDFAVETFADAPAADAAPAGDAAPAAGAGSDAAGAAAERDKPA